MKRTLGKSVSVILVLACMLSAFCIGARAVEVEPCYTGIMSLSATLDISSGGQASCYGYVSSRSGYSVDLKMKLQRDGRTIKPWTDSGSKGFDILKTYYVTPGHDYQVVVTATVYNSSGKIVETPSAYSNEVSY